MNRLIKSISIFLIIFFLSIPAHAAYNALMFPKFKWTNYATGAAASGWKVNCYENGTTTRKTSYSTPTGTANTNPVILDTHGEADIYLDGVYTIVLTDGDDDVTKGWTLNDVEGAAISSIVASIAATVAAIGTGTTDGELIMIAATTNNFYTWDGDNSKWRVKSGGIFTTAALPVAATYTIETGTIVFDSTALTIKYWDGTAWSAYSGVFTTVTATSAIIGRLSVTTSAVAIDLSEAQVRGNVIIMTAAGDVELPDSCDTATGANVLVFVRDVAETVSIAVIDPADTIIYPGLALDADDELDSPGDAGDWVSLVCMEANKWYVVGNRGLWTDGGPAD